jgi:hypothetical protein
MQGTQPPRLASSRAPAVNVTLGCNAILVEWKGENVRAKQDKQLFSDLVFPAIGTALRAQAARWYLGSLLLYLFCVACALLVVLAPVLQ